MTSPSHDFEEIDRHFEKTRRALDAIKAADAATELRDAWEEFLTSFHRAIGRIIASSIKNSDTRGWGHKLKNASSGGDEGLSYLREARAHAEHALTPFARFREPSVSIGGNAIGIGGNSSVTFVGSSVNGMPVGDFSIETKNGRIHKLNGQPKMPVVQKSASVTLVDIVSTEKRQTYSVPTKILGQALKSNKPEELANVGLRALEKLYSEYKVRRSRG